MDRARAIIEKIACKSDKAILFHSASGKDSIALLDLLAPHFKQIVCVYMYVVKDLTHINRYIRYAERKYPNAKFIQVPHFALSSYRKYGHMGLKADDSVRLVNLNDIVGALKERLGIEWAFLGFKKSDSMNRRLMLGRYEDEAINEQNKACYPLSAYKNSDIIDYIKRNGLIYPECYGKSQSSGTAIDELDYLLFLRKNYPEDLKKVFADFPLSERVLFEYDYEQNKAERDDSDMEVGD